MKRKWMSCIAAAVLLMMTGSNAAIAAPKYQWRIASEEIAGSVADMYAHEFARLLKEKSKGAIQLDVYPSGTLGSPTEMFELTLNGAVDNIAITSARVRTNFLPLKSRRAMA